MKIVGVTMITNPDFRQDPWRESIAQMTLLADIVVVVCGRAADVKQVKEQFPDGNVEAVFLNWPQPVWTYDELPRHLNLGMDIARQYAPDWIIKFDIDNFFHEKDIATIRAEFGKATNKNKKAASFEKYQFHRVSHAYEKGKIPIAINANHVERICYGKDEKRYNDLCQPIVPNGGTFRYKPDSYDVPIGTVLTEEDIHPMPGVHVWNYDYTFKTEGRSRELLYHFELSHIAFWGSSYCHRSKEEMTEQVAFDDFLEGIKGRAQRANKRFNYYDHPHHLQDRVKNIKPEEFGSNLWNKIPL